MMSCLWHELNRSPHSKVEEDVVYFKLSFRNPRYEPLEEEPKTVTPDEMVCLFPLPSEDPHALTRKAQSLLEVMGGSTIGGQEAVEHGARLHRFGWSSFPVKRKVAGSLRFSQHLLLKVLDHTLIYLFLLDVNYY